MQISARPNPPRSDLTVKKLTPSTSIVHPGDQVTFTVELANQGQVDAGACNLYLDGGYNGDLKVRIAGLAAGQSGKLSLGPLTISDWAEHQGVTAFIDSDKEIDESSERNNKKSTTLWYPQPGPPWPPGPPIPPSPIPHG